MPQERAQSCSCPYPVFVLRPELDQACNLGSKQVLSEVEHPREVGQLLVACGRMFCQVLRWECSLQMRETGEGHFFDKQTLRHTHLGPYRAF